MRELRSPARLLLLLGVWAMAVPWIWTILAMAEPEVAKGCVMECTPNRYASKKIPLPLLKSYQNSTCQGTFSVILTTVGKQTYCARPSDDWVQKATRELDAKDAAKSMPNKSSATPTLGWAVGPAHSIGTATSRSSSSRVSKENMTPSRPLSVSTRGNSLLSKSTRGPTSETTLDLTTMAQIKDSISQLSTSPDADERSRTTMRVEDRNNAAKDRTVTTAEYLVSSLPMSGSRDCFPQSPKTMPTSGFHQENMEEGSKGPEIEKTPLIPASILPEYQTSTISMTVAGGIFFILFVGLAAWAYFKTHLCARTPRQMIRGLEYSPIDSYASDFPMQNLLVVPALGSDFAPCVGVGQARSGKQDETDGGGFLVFTPLPEEGL